MNIFKLAFELFIIYMVYKVVFDFIIPVYRTTKHMKQKVTEMHQKMQEQQETNNNSDRNTVRQTEPAKKPFAEDYIDYEEIK